MNILSCSFTYICYATILCTNPYIGGRVVGRRVVSGGGCRGVLTPSPHSTLEAAPLLTATPSGLASWTSWWWRPLPPVHGQCPEQSCILSEIQYVYALFKPPPPRIFLFLFERPRPRMLLEKNHTCPEGRRCWAAGSSRWPWPLSPVDTRRNS